jgi:hypothetical protein
MPSTAFPGSRPCSTWLRGLSALSTLIAAAVGLLIAVRAFCDYDRAWDSSWYHLPAAGRMVGSLPDAVFHSSGLPALYFSGFPMLGEWLQGLLWRLTGRVESANLVAFCCALAFLVVLRCWQGFPLGLTGLALAAVPVVHIHASMVYVDLPAGVGAALAWIAAYVLLFTATRPLPALVIGAMAGALALNFKMSVLPVVAAGFALLAMGIWRRRSELSGCLRALAAAVLILAILGGARRYLINAAEYGNPLYPVAVRVGGHSLPGPYVHGYWGPRNLVAVSTPVRWLWSVWEKDRVEALPWTYDQGLGEPAGKPGERLGGFGREFVLLNLAAFGVLVTVHVRKGRRRPAMGALLCFLLLTILCAVIPGGHVLRFGMCWMLVLLALNVRLVATVAPAERWLSVAYGLCCLLALAYFEVRTQGQYTRPRFIRATDIAPHLHLELLEPARQTGQVCILGANPYTMLYAAPFHQEPTPYRVIDAQQPADCAGAPMSRTTDHFPLDWALPAR